MRDSKRKFCIVGTGGFGRETLLVLIDVLSAVGEQLDNQAVFLVSDEYYQEPEIMGVPVIKLSEFDEYAYQVVVAIGEPLARKAMVDQLPNDTCYTTLVHPTAVLSAWVTLGEGSIVCAGVVMTCNIQVGSHAHFNLNSTVGHDCVIGDFFTSAPGVNISGNCTFGDFVYFGTNASVKEGIRLCDEVTVGMGAVVVKHIDSKGVYIGNPCKPI